MGGVFRFHQTINASAGSLLHSFQPEAAEAFGVNRGHHQVTHSKDGLFLARPSSWVVSFVFTDMCKYHSI